VFGEADPIFMKEAAIGRCFQVLEFPEFAPKRIPDC